MKILGQDQINDTSYVLWLKEDKQPRPGQFYMVYPEDGSRLLGRPISVFDYKPGRLGLLYEVVGQGTKDFSKMKAKDQVRVLGPYGHGFSQPKDGARVAFVAGGVGLAPLVYFSKFLKAPPKVYFGSRDTSGYEEYLKDYGLDLEIHQGGFITDYVDYRAYDCFYTCGPRPMMKKVLDDCIFHEKDLELSMEERMGCGFGACLGCSIKTKDGQRKVCQDGPVFRKEDFIHA